MIRTSNESHHRPASRHWTRRGRVLRNFPTLETVKVVAFGCSVATMGATRLLESTGADSAACTESGACEIARGREQRRASRCPTLGWNGTSSDRPRSKEDSAAVHGDAQDPARFAACKIMFIECSSLSMSMVVRNYV